MKLFIPKLSLGIIHINDCYQESVIINFYNIIIYVWVEYYLRCGYKMKNLINLSNLKIRLTNR